MNKKGSLSVEALLSFSFLMMLLLTIISVFSFIAKEDQLSQVVFDEINTLSIDHYLMQKVGIENLDFLEDVDHLLPETLQEFLGNKLSSYTEMIAIETWMQLRLQYQLEEKTEVDRVKVSSLSLKGDILEVEIDYTQRLAMGMMVDNSIKASTKMWYFGNDPGIFNQNSLSDLLEEDSEISYVYVTKLGSKYHTEDCFYIKRSTTDQSGVKKIPLELAKKTYSPCRLCILKELIKWKWPK